MDSQPNPIFKKIAEFPPTREVSEIVDFTAFFQITDLRTKACFPNPAFKKIAGFQLNRKSLRNSGFHYIFFQITDLRTKVRFRKKTAFLEKAIIAYAYSANATQ